MLIVFAGLPGTGKSSLARHLARELDAVWLRIDSIEQAIQESGVIPGSIEDAVYRAAYAIAGDNLRLGRTVIGDCVNSCTLTRNPWRDVGVQAGVRVLEIETICSNIDEHRGRVEGRPNEIPGLKLPNWEEVTGGEYHPWDSDHVTIDTAGRSVEECVFLIRKAMG
jgi:predicted kinase